MIGYRLVQQATGEEVSVGAQLVDFKGQSCEVIGFTPPRTSNSTGRVSLRYPDQEAFEYFPSVAGLAIVPATDLSSEEVDNG